jgi:uncharacterized protein
MDHYRWDGEDLILHCHLQPKSSRDEIVGVYGDRLKLRISAAPVDGKANAQLIKFLSKAFAAAKTDITILQGEQGRKKTIKIHNPSKLPQSAAITPQAV